MPTRQIPVRSLIIMNNTIPILIYALCLFDRRRSSTTAAEAHVKYTLLHVLKYAGGKSGDTAPHKCFLTRFFPKRWAAFCAAAHSSHGLMVAADGAESIVDSAFSFWISDSSRFVSLAPSLTDSNTTRERFRSFLKRKLVWGSKRCQVLSAARIYKKKNPKNFDII